MRRKLSSWEQMEDRLCMTVAAALSVNDLVLTGTPDGAVEILAIDADTYQVSDAGAIVATIDGVTDDIRIALKASASGGNNVTLDLAQVAAVDSLMASLGNGTNTFTLSGGTVTSLRYIGGKGSDTVEFADDFTLGLATTTSARCFGGGGSAVSLGAGDNSLIVDGTVNGNLEVSAGAGIDSVTITDTASVSGRVAASLGAGDNSITVDGEIIGNLDVRTGDGADTVTISASGSVGNAMLNLGAGDNTFTLSGAVTNDVAYQGGAGNDAVTISDSVLVGRSVKLILGAGDNTVDLSGAIGGDFVVRSENADDVITVADTAVISGTSDIQPGVATIAPLRGRGPGGRGPAFGFGRR